MLGILDIRYLWRWGVRCSRVKFFGFGIDSSFLVERYFAIVWLCVFLVGVLDYNVSFRVSKVAGVFILLGI